MPKLQGIAEQIHRAAIPKQVQLGFLHASGEQLIREGVNDGSRKHASALLGPACGESLKQIVREFALTTSSGIKIDYFPAASTAIVQRLVAWTAESGAQIGDTFSAQSAEIAERKLWTILGTVVVSAGGGTEKPGFSSRRKVWRMLACAEQSQMGPVGYSWCPQTEELRSSCV
jgi:hypothetical protein